MRKQKLSLGGVEHSTSAPTYASTYLDPLLWLTPLTSAGLNPFGGSPTTRTAIDFAFGAAQPNPYTIFDPESSVDSLVATNWNKSLGSQTQTVITTDGQTKVLTGEQAAVYSALSAWASVANIDLHLSTSLSTADFKFLVTNDTGMQNFWSGEKGVLGFTELPYNYGPNYGVDDPHYSPGFSVYNQGGFGWTAGGLQPSGYGYVTVLHEIGHLFGLDHPWNEGGYYINPDLSRGAPEPFFPGATGASQTGDYGLNQGVFTTMTYNDGWKGQPSKSADWATKKDPEPLT